jgi:hypothetical protein
MLAIRNIQTPVGWDSLLLHDLDADRLDDAHGPRIVAVHRMDRRPIVAGALRALDDEVRPRGLSLRRLGSPGRLG